MEKEKILTYSWKEFLQTPFSLMFFACIIAIGWFVYQNRQDHLIEKQECSDDLRNCNEKLEKNIKENNEKLLKIAYKLQKIDSLQ